MATITTEFGIVNLSMVELRELIGATNGNSAIESIVAETTPKRATRKAPKPTEQPTLEISDDDNSSENSETETLHCINGDHDYQRPRSRGRKPVNCPDHKDGGNSDNGAEDGSEGNSDGETETPKPKRQYNRRNNDGGGKNTFAEWLEKHADEPMTEKMEKSIRWQLTVKQIGDSNIAKINKALDANPRMTCAAASKIIGFLHKLPKIEK